MFTKDSTVAKVWAKAVLNGEKKIEDVPKLYNLYDVVCEIVEGGGIENV